MLGKVHSVLASHPQIFIACTRKKDTYFVNSVKTRISTSIATEELI